MTEPKPRLLIPHSRFLVIAAVLIGGSSALLGYGLGHRQGMSAIGANAREVADLHQAVKDQKTAIDILNRTLATTVQERDIAVESAKELKTQVASEVDLRTLSESRLQSYQTILAERGGVDLTVHSIHIAPLPERAYEYRIDLMGLRPSLGNLIGTITLQLVNGESVLLVPLSQNRFSFQAFERLTGRFTMPSGFTPQYLDVIIQSAGQRIVKRYAWERGDVIKDMPATLADVPPLPVAQAQ
jgi:hypothetical protein